MDIIIFYTVIDLFLMYAAYQVGVFNGLNSLEKSMWFAPWTWTLVDWANQTRLVLVVLGMFLVNMFLVNMPLSHNETHHAETHAEASP